MAKTKLTCENCGHEEELTAKQLKERADNGKVTCKECGNEIELPEASTDATKNAGEGQKEQTEAAPEAGEKQKEQEGAFVRSESKADTAKENAKLAAEAAKAKLKEAIAEGRKNPVFAANFLNMLLKKLATCPTGEKVGKITSISISIGHYALLLAAVAVLALSIIISVRTLSIAPVISGVFGAVMLIFAQYLAIKGFALMEGYIEKNSSKIPHEALMEILSACYVIFGLLCLFLGVAGVVIKLTPILLGLGILGFITCYFAAGASLQYAKKLNISIEKDMPISQVIVELVSAKLKVAVFIMPYVFGLGGAVMAVFMLWPLVGMILFGATQTNVASLHLQACGLAFCALYPIIIYLTVLVYAFVVEVARGLLKLAKLK